MGWIVETQSSEKQSAGAWSAGAWGVDSWDVDSGGVDPWVLDASSDIKYALGGTSQDKELFWNSFKLEDVELDTDLEVAGHIERAEGLVQITRDGRVSVLQANDVILSGDVISSGENSEISLRFIDKSELQLGSDGKLSIDGFSYDGGSSKDFQALSLYRGSFSYSSGLIARQDSRSVDFSTPYGSISVREAKLLGKVSEDSGTLFITTLEGRVSLLQGSLELAGVSGLFKTLIVTRDGVERSFVIRSESASDILSRYDFLDGDFAELQSLHPNIPHGLGGATSNSVNRLAGSLDDKDFLATIESSFLSGSDYQISGLLEILPSSSRFSSGYSSLDEHFSNADDLSTALELPLTLGNIFSSFSIDLLAAYSFHNGSASSEVIVGNYLIDIIHGYSGDDHLYGGAGSDLLSGGDGIDELYGESGVDRLFGDSGNDKLFGGVGDDYLHGGDDNDVLEGGIGDDELAGGIGDDVLDGGIGDDKLYGGAGIDDLYGRAGNDLLAGGAGDDVLDGGIGDDKLYGGAGIDDLYGRAGNDLLDGGIDDDLLYGGSGVDHLYGRSGDDILEGEIGYDILYGGAGEDVLYGGSGIDRLYGEADNDVLEGEIGYDILYGGNGDDILYGGKGNDELRGGADDDDYLFYFADGSDTITDSGGGDIKFISNKEHFFVAGDFSFTKQSNTLVIEVKNGVSSPQSVTVSDYYLPSTNTYTITYEDNLGTAHALTPPP